MALSAMAQLWEGRRSPIGEESRLLRAYSLLAPRAAGLVSQAL
jgi:hypothetical protein